MEEEDVVCMSVNQAARLGMLDQMKELISTGHPVDAKDNRGWRPVHEAAAANHIDCLRELLANETTDLSWVSHEECSPLYLAAVEGHCAAGSLLLEHGANPSQTDVMKNSPLIAATRSGSVQMVRLLVSGGADVNWQQYTGSAALHLVAAEGRRDMLEVLLGGGARLDVYEDYHISPVFTAAQYGQTACLKALLEHAKTTGQEVLASTPAEDGGTPLYLAAQEGHLPCVNLLLRNGADANALTNEPVALPLHAALEFGHYQCVVALLPYTNDDIFKYCDISPWCFAMNHSDQTCLQTLIDCGMDVNYTHPLAEDETFEPSVLTYCTHNVKFSRKVLPLVSLPIYRCPTNNAKVLLQAGARAYALGDEVPPLLAAINEKVLDYMKILVSYGAPVNEYHPHCLGNLTLLTALHHWKGLNFLLKVGADPTLNFALKPPQNWATLTRKKTNSKKEKKNRPRTDDISDSDSDSESPGNHGYRDNQGGSSQSLLTFHSVLSGSRHMATKKSPTVGMILYQMLQYVGNVSLDPRLEGLLEHRGDWTTLVAFTDAPRPLTHLCRLAIRRCLSTYRLLDDRRVHSLPLPETVINYLLYQELDPEEPFKENR